MFIKYMYIFAAIIVFIIICYLLHLFYNTENKGTDNFIFVSPNTETIKPKESKTYVGEDGYRHFSDSDKRVHVWVMEKSIGRKLNYGEVVHHKDGNKLNNKLENLRLFSSQEEHDRFHREHLKNHGSWYEEVPEYTNYKKYREYARQY